ncbi:molecular chaperone [Lactococcus lactis subsp. lactis]|uniref:Molecular chaperone n=1 Tax=Lactococcus lactis subsp. lactis TaxID=1360 RepID=A0A0B8QQ56_LACLL|nr:hypothetical protein ATCC19435_1921 [Lactococcus lactis subsp. lactis]GAM80771.1 molecular chaperone [Lactococcus lactis subsp. lactis]CDI45842.1 hypothetical protein BN927_02004 [Lactococcus lactis subsp. lactis Dephy 1]
MSGLSPIWYMCKVVLPELLFYFADEPQATSVKAASTDTVPSATF